MKLARKLVFAFLTAIVSLLAIYGYVRVERESALFETDMIRDAHTMGHALAAAVSDVWRADGEARARELIARSNDPTSDLRIRWVWIDDAAGVLGSADALALAAGKETVRMSPERGTINTYVPVSISSPRKGALEIAESLAPRARYVHGSILSTVVTTLVLSTVCGLIALWVGVAFVGRPIHALIEQARRIGAGDLSKRLHLHQLDEIGELSSEMNSMSDRLEAAYQRVEAEASAKTAAEEQLRHAERLTTVGKLASGVAHELGTPLNVVGVRAKMIAVGEAKGDAVAENAKIIVQESERMAAIIRQLLDFARRRTGSRAEIDLVPIADQTVALLEPLAQKTAVCLSVEAAPGRHVIDGDPGQMTQVLTNLVINAVHAMPEGGAVRIFVASEQRAAANDPSGERRAWVAVRVVDEGQGIPESIRPHIFEPFFTTKQVGEGTGLGLSVAYGIVQDHGGFIEVKSEVLRGSAFTLYLPRRSENA